MTGCFQSSAMVGPAITFASTGNVSQAGLAYFTNRAVKEETGMSTTEYVSTFLEEKTKKTKKNEKIYEELMILVQTNFEQTRKNYYYKINLKLLIKLI